MSDAANDVDNGLPLPILRQTSQPSIADQVFDILQQRILSLELPPHTRLSESEVAGKMGVSRQPVREAFKRLEKQGFLCIRPQSRTTVSGISEQAILQARFIRTALEVHTCRAACESMSSTGLAALKALLDQQKAAVVAQDSKLFHALDDQFHREICIQSGVEYVWDLIHDSKAHMDRIRMLTLSMSTQKLALKEHLAIFKAISSRKPDTAAAAMTSHLSRILVLIEEIKVKDHTWFTEQSE
jgi:GntR family transcriptional regulator, rspAB operon transcriptional repressor